LTTGDKKSSKKVVPSVEEEEFSKMAVYKRLVGGEGPPEGNHKVLRKGPEHLWWGSGRKITDSLVKTI